MPSVYKITKRGQSINLYIRFYVPLEYQEVVGKAEIWRSLKTPDKLEASERAIKTAGDILSDLKLQAARRSLSEKPSQEVIEPTYAQIEEAARQVYEMLVESDLQERSSSVEAALMGMGDKDSAKVNKREAKRIREAMGRGDFSVADLEYWSDHFSFEFNPGSPVQDSYHQCLARAHAEAAERWAEHDMGRTGGKPSDKLFRRPKGVSAPLREALPDAEGSAFAQEVNDPPVPALTALWGDYVRHVGDSNKADTTNDRKVAVGMFSEFVEASKPTSEITKADAREFVNLLHDMPKKAAQRLEFRGLSPKQIVEKNEQLGLPTLSVTTIRKYVSGLSGYYDWLIKQGYVSENIWSGMAPAKSKKRSDRPPFTVPHLQKLFSSPLFLGCAGTRDIRQISTPGPVLIRDGRYWLPLLAAFTGARQGELAQLEKTDVRSDQGIHYLRITDEGSDEQKSVKSGAGFRSVPLHSKLLELGFLEYVEKQSGPRLFPEAKRDSRGQFGPVSKFFQKYFATMKFEPDSQGNLPVFHSFRHSVADGLRRKHDDYIIGLLLGHEKNTVTRGYGKSETLDIERRKALVEDIVYRELDLSALVFST